MNAVHYSSKSPEHLTPPAILEAAIRVMGGIDLDPCADPGHNVPAACHFTAEDKGLGLLWSGRVYMNPPYGAQIGHWIYKLLTEHQVGHVVEAIALVPARTDTRWWAHLRDYPVCLVRSRLRFGGNGNNHPAPFPSAVFYLGPRPWLFCREFTQFGDIWRKVSA